MNACSTEASGLRPPGVSGCDPPVHGLRLSGQSGGYTPEDSGKPAWPHLFQPVIRFSAMQEGSGTYPGGGCRRPGTPGHPREKSPTSCKRVQRASGKTEQQYARRGSPQYLPEAGPQACIPDLCPGIEALWLHAGSLPFLRHTPSVLCLQGYHPPEGSSVYTGHRGRPVHRLLRHPGLPQKPFDVPQSSAPGLLPRQPVVH